MVFTKDKLDELRDAVKEHLDSRRYTHTLGVEQCAIYLGEIFCPELVPSLQVAALLHDVAKNKSLEEKFELIKSIGYKMTEDDVITSAAYHSFAAPGAIKKYFPDFFEENICSAVFNHTLGAPDMSLFDEIIFIADYIEEGRTYPACVYVRDTLYSELNSAVEFDEKKKALHWAVVKAIEYTVNKISMDNFPVHPKTLLTKNAFLSLI